jgi:hypothetical protein
LIESGKYQYKVIGVEKETQNRLLLDQISINSKSDTGLRKYKAAALPLSFRKKGDVEITVINPENNTVLTAFTYEYVSPESLYIDLTTFVDKGVKRFWIKMKQVETKETRYYAYQISEIGDLVLVEK